MTLKEWSDQAGVEVEHPEFVADSPTFLYLANKDKTPNYKELWSLSDYDVSAVTGPVVWLLPKPKEPKP